MLQAATEANSAASADFDRLAQQGIASRGRALTGSDPRGAIEGPTRGRLSRDKRSVVKGSPVKFRRGPATVSG